MTAIAISSTGAFPTNSMSWDAIPWLKATELVRRLQMRIAKAIKEGKRGKAKVLQRLLTHSFYAKLLAVKRVSQNSGSKTAGVDGVIWKNAKEKMQAAKTLKQWGYQPQPLRRIYIPKKSSNMKYRPLGIPVMKDRAMQALYLLALEPIAESLADRNSYGFRVSRSCADAIEQCFNALAKKSSAQWILEGDIKSCFDKISHIWLEENILMDKTILNKWLKSGYIEKRIFHQTKEGTPQGGIISPTAANIVLDGMEALVKNITEQPDKVNFVRYADDFIVTGSTKEVLEDKIKPAIELFLEERGLELSQEKTQITHIDDGFDFLGFNVRKYGGKLLIKPAKNNVLSFLKDIRVLIKENGTAKTEELIRKLNARIRGWANYYRHAVSKNTFSYVDHRIFEAVIRWMKRRHPDKNFRWLRNKYFRRHKLRDWIFFTKIRNKKGESLNLDLFPASSVKIKRHIKIKSDAHPFDPAYKDYFDKRANRNKISSRDVGPDERHLPIF
jgi:RNA-directed DNA polymerase